MNYSVPCCPLSLPTDSRRWVHRYRFPIASTPSASGRAAASMLGAAAVALVLAVCLASVAHAQTPFPGTPMPIPGVFEAEDFDLGGEGVAYHDNVPGNAGGQYRPYEDADIIASSDPEGGNYVVNNFETGEWLSYSIDVASSARYDIELRMSSTFSDSAYHVEIDRQNVTGTITAPNTGNWNTFQWVSKKGVPLVAGRHELRIFTERQYFNLNTVKVTTTPTSTPPSSPFFGAPMPVPGTLEAENFDLGSEGVAYHDNVPGNAGGQYRPSEDVDVFMSTDPGGGNHIVKNFEVGEWLAYTISVPASDSYDIEIRASTHVDFPNAAYHIEIDGVNVTGTMVLPATNTVGWDRFQWLGKRTVHVDAGQHVLKIVADQQYFDLNAIKVTPAPTSAPFFGVPVSLPGSLQAEDFDLGGEGVAYHDNVPGNAGGQYRPDEDVDIIVSRDSAGGSYAVNNFETGEWLAYTISVASSGQYDIAIRAASMFSNTAFHMEIDGVNVTGTIPVPNTGSWSAFQWIGKQGVFIVAGQHVLKLLVDREHFDVNEIRVLASTAPTTIRVEEKGATSAGSWIALGAESATFSGGSALTSSVAGDTSTFTFSGTAVTWIGLKCDVCGIATVSVGGGAPATVDTAGPASPGSAGLASEGVFTASGLSAEGTHTLTITVAGNTTSGGAYVVIDAFDVTGTGPAAARIEDRDAAVAYTTVGSWIFLTDSRATNSTAAESQVAGARATLTFTGTQVRWIGYHHSGGGVARIFVDETFVGEADQYAPTQVLQPVSFAVSGLPRGTHTLTIEVTGTKRPESVDTWVLIDAFDVMP